MKEKNIETKIKNSKEAIEIFKAFGMLTGFISLIIMYINLNVKINAIWNICYLVPTYLVFIVSIFELIICFWKLSTKMYIRLIFSASITYIVYIVLIFIYAILTFFIFM